MPNDRVSRHAMRPGRGAKHYKQAGFASILLILFIGLALTTMIIGMVSTVGGLQDSSITLHAQTQAQIKSAIGYQALSGFFKDRTAAQIASINNGTIKQGTLPVASYVKTATDCPASTASKSYYCFDITANSGGASSIVRAIYSEQALGSSAFNGSMFAGGLQVGHTDNLQGNQSIQVGSADGLANGLVKGNGSKIYTAEEFRTATGITVTPYTGATFSTAQDLRSYANYIFLSNGTCAKNNLYSVVSGVTTNITVETTPVTCPGIAGISSSGSGSAKIWTVSASDASLPVGVFWFEGAVNVNLSPGRDLVNTIIATGNISITTSDNGNNNAYAPNHYSLEASATSDIKKARICGSVATGVPTQYCNYDLTLKNMDTELAKIANILFLSNGDITFDVKNNKDMKLYGNIVGAGGAGGTGASSGKFTGTGIINIKGNLVFTGTGTTATNGNVNVTLTESDSAGNAAPSIKIMTLSGLRYL